MHDQLHTRTYNEIHDQLHTRTYTEMHDQLHTRTYTEMHDQLHTRTYTEMHDQLHTRTYTEMHDQLHTRTYNEMHDRQTYKGCSWTFHLREQMWTEEGTHHLILQPHLRVDGLRFRFCFTEEPVGHHGRPWRPPR